jgi:hypothetical protein
MKYICTLLVTIIALFSYSGFANDNIPGRYISDQPDENDDYQIHLIYLLAKDSKDRKWDVNGNIGKIIDKANSQMFKETKKNKYSNGVGKIYKFDIRKDGKLDISFLRLDKNNSELPKHPNNYILEYLWENEFNDPRKIYFSFSEIKTNDGGEAGVGMGTVFLGSRYNKSKSPKGSDFNHITLHEILHTQGVGFPCMPKVKHGHLKDEYHMLGHGTRLNKKIYAHDVEGCPELRNSVFLSPTSEESYDPYQLVCLGKIGVFNHKDMSVIRTDFQTGKRNYAGPGCKWNQGREKRALDRYIMEQN